MSSIITSSLTKWQKKKLCSLLSHDRLCLLFKASVHGYNVTTFHQKCNTQGPTVIVAYNKSGYVFGAFTSKDYGQTGQNVVDDKAFLFSFNDKEVKEDPLHVFSGNPQYSFSDNGPNFDSLVFLYNNTATVYSNPVTYKFDPHKMHGNDLQLTECEVYRVEDCGGLLEKPWRNVQWTSERRKALLSTISGWKPSVSSVKQARILLVGPVGAGKSSFFNSINSVFKGYVSSQANTGTAGTSLTTQFRTYYIKPGSGVSHVPFTLCDSMGLEEGLNSGLDVDDFASILKGHIQDKYQFNPSMPIQPDSPHFHKSPGLKDKIHCVVYVIDASKVKLLSDKMNDKFAVFRRKTNQLGIPQLVLLTKVDEACPIVAEDLKNVYQSHYINKMVQEVTTQLGVSMSAVIPVKNYCQELEIDPQTDILLLNAVVQILRAAEGFFDDLYNPEEMSD
ncbi:interferon-induced protein 44-like [Rhinichthys klamathensis goyatoka]|uniref:interferon-induced protein 44-like n=1 Tax=Rhinichthys klamathensis goyatoka TaxID=3034132 RepID=UPI0024B4D144|nr:interferon-induced protein 44-like [Rhinichthys klamathensis goyatoka]